MLLWGRSTPVSFSEGCRGARRVPRVTVTGGMPCADLGLWRRPNSEFIYYVLLSLLLLICLVAPVEAGFMRDSKVRFSQDGGDHWTVRGRIPVLGQMTVCVHVRLLVPGEWTAYTYGRPHAPRPELALQGDRNSLHVWLQGAKHSFPVRLLPRSWHRICLKRDAGQKRVSLDVDGSPSVRTVAAESLSPAGHLVLGSKDQGGRPSGAKAVELYLFRVWDDIDHHGDCEDGSVVAWRTEQWDMGGHAPLHDGNLLCGPRRMRRQANLPSTTAATSPSKVTTDDPPIPPLSRKNPPTPLTTFHKVSSDISPVTTASITALSSMPVTSQPTLSRQPPTAVITRNQPTSFTPHSTIYNTFPQPTSSTEPPTTVLTSNEPTFSTQSPAVVITAHSSTQHTSTTPHSTTFAPSSLPTSSTESPPSVTTSTQLTYSTSHSTAFTASTQQTYSTSQSTADTASTQQTYSTSQSTAYTASTQQTYSASQSTAYTASTQQTYSTSQSTAYTASTQQTYSTSQSTAYTASPAPSSVSFSATSTEPVLNSSLMLQCSFSDLCANKSAFYWMVLEMQSTGKNSAESPEVIKTWLQSVFNISACVPSSVGASSNSIVSSVREGTCQNEKETSVSLFQGIEVMCDDEENESPRETNCTTLLELSRLIDPCVLHQALETAKDTSFTARLVGTVERVGKGQCTGAVMIPAVGGFEKCNSSLPVSEICHTEGPVKCKRYAETVVVPVESLSPVGQNCTASKEKEEQGCDCSAFCSETAAYYTLTLGVTDPTIIFSDIRSLIYKLGSTPQTCNSSDCTEVPIIAQVYQECFGMGAQINNCTVVLKLAKAVHICTLRATLVSLIEKKEGVFYNGSLRQVAICGWPAGSSDNMSIANFTWINATKKYSQICQGNSIISYNCESGVTLGVPLTEVCMPDSPFTPTSSQPNTTTPHESKGTTSPPNITRNTTQIFIPVTTLNAESQAERLLELTRDVSSLNSSQVEQLVTQLEGLLSGPNISLALGQTAITIVSNLLNASVETLASSSNRIIGLVDTVGLKLVVQAEEETILSDSVALAVQKVDGANFQETSFSITNPSNVQINRAVRSGTSSSPQGSITLPPNLTAALTPQQQLLASRVQFNFYQKSTVFQDRNLQGRRLNSGILGTSVANLSITNLADKVFITLKNNEPVPANFVASCVFWDFTRNDGSGGWNPSGCSVENSTDEETYCSCNHLTSFAILLDISREGISNRLQSIILTYITNIGCGISAIFLSVTLLTYLAFEKLRKDIPSKILIQLCTALLLLNLTFLLDSWLALYPEADGLCISTAFFLHYFLLVSFTWMCLEAVHMYLALVKVFNTYVSRYMLKFSLVGWGVPLVVVIIVIAINSGKNYGLVSYGKFPDGSTDDFCWLKNDVAFYVAVVAYFCVVFLVNLTMFVVVIVQLVRIKRQNPHNAQHRSTLQNMRSVAGLTIILGLTWGFAFFAWGPVNLPFMYLFAIFNSLQGFFIFIFHCAIKENVRRQWRAYLCCGKLRLPENTEWSRTATHRRTTNRHGDIKATSFGSSNSLHSGNTSSTSFLASDSTVQANGIDGVYEDRQMTALEQPNGDVLLNEIHSRHSTPRGQ